MKKGKKKVNEKGAICGFLKHVVRILILSSSLHKNNFHRRRSLFHSITNNISGKIVFPLDKIIS